MSNKKEGQIVQSGQSALTHGDVPEFLKAQKGHQAGMEDVEQSDIIMPRLGLCQALSPQRRSSDPNYLPDLKEGEFFNTVSGEIYGKEIDLICLFFFKNRIKYIDLKEGGGIDCSSPNAIDGGRISPMGCASCRFSAWGNGAIDKESPEANEAPLCTLYHNYMCFLHEVSVPTPIALSYKSTGIKLSKQLLANVRITNLPMYSKTYHISSIIMRKDNNEWFEKKITPGAYVDKSLFDSMDSL
ncbi:MAG TPA: hypothetical protein VGF75_05505, partial [Candidatus Saccharimonadales bacterium]